LKKAPGATFELKNRIYDLNVGEAVIFPSKIDHRANPPIDQERWAFTIWYMKSNNK
jgi:predicted 2-oxoglutarate/Fe(II)-dependent dioxygenase YbiX